MCEYEESDTIQRQIHRSVREGSSERGHRRGTSLEILISLDLIITTRIMQRGDESTSVSVNSNGQSNGVREAV